MAMAMAIAMIRKKEKIIGDERKRFDTIQSAHGAFGIFFMIRMVVESYISGMLET